MAKSPPSFFPKDSSVWAQYERLQTLPQEIACALAAVIVARTLSSLGITAIAKGDIDTARAYACMSELLMVFCVEPYAPDQIAADDAAYKGVLH